MESLFRFRKYSSSYSNIDMSPPQNSKIIVIKKNGVKYETKYKVFDLFENNVLNITSIDKNKSYFLIKKELL